MPSPKGTWEVNFSSNLALDPSGRELPIPEASEPVGFPALDRNDIEMWAEWRKHTSAPVYTSRATAEDKGFWCFRRNGDSSSSGTSNRFSSRRAPDSDLHRICNFPIRSFWNERKGVRKEFSGIRRSSLLIAETRDMTMADLLREDSLNIEEPRRRMLQEKSAGRTKWRNEQTALHEICRTGTSDEVLQRLQQQQASHYRMSRYRVKYPVTIVPKDEISVCNEQGRLPLHVAATNRQMIEVADLDQSSFEDSRQAAPAIVTTLVTGRSPSNGQTLFDVERDTRNRCMPCMHQDYVGMTPLHLAAMSDSSSAFEVVCTLIEANPLAAAVYDMDGFLPLDLACRNPSRGSSEIVKVLLRAYPQAAIVEESVGLKEDWIRAWGKIHPCRNTDSVQPAEGLMNKSMLMDSDLAAVTDGVVFNEYEERHRGAMTYGMMYPAAYKDLSYLLPQRVSVQHLLLELSSFYRYGNFSVPGPLNPLDNRALREKLASDIRTGRNGESDSALNAPETVIYAGRCGGTSNAMKQAIERQNFLKMNRNKLFRGTWKDLSDIALPVQEQSPGHTRSIRSLRAASLSPTNDGCSALISARKRFPPEAAEGEAPVVPATPQSLRISETCIAQHELSKNLVENFIRQLGFDQETGKCQCN
jgi:hypothetical protein